MKRIPFCTTKDDLVKRFLEYIDAYLEPYTYRQEKVQEEIDAIHEHKVFGDYEIDVMESEEDCHELGLDWICEPLRVGDVVLSENGIAFYKFDVEPRCDIDEINTVRRVMHFTFHEMLHEECEKANCI